MNDGLLENKLRRAEYTSLRYQLRLEEDFFLPAYALLRLRRELNRVLKGDLHGHWRNPEFRTLLQPELPTDPLLIRRVQQPAPGFILAIDSVEPHQYRAGDSLCLTVCFFAKGLSLIEPFSQVLDALGVFGLCGNSGRFHLEQIETDSDSHPQATLWEGGPFHLTPTLNDLTSKLEGVPASSVCFEMRTPARLLKNSRPLFRPYFIDIFPYILRRVTGMLAIWADLEELFDIQYLLDCALQVVESDNRLRWQDWRPLHKHEEVGGICGSVCLSGDGLRELWPVLRLGELYGLGKGAAFGAGRYQLI